ncbi:MAG: EAL domain-containing protein [Candidatus Sedimenticola endophacoides]
MAGPQIERGDIAATVQQVLAETLLPPPYLELEITEGFIMRSVEAALQALERLKELGIWISIDDFGTGYSSLSYLKRLPVDQLKIDQGFVRGIPQDADAAAITTAVIALAQSMGYMVIAEGVESDGQRRFLLDEGCRYGQGFLYSKPLDSAAFEKWLNRYAKHYAR